jgi:Velvet factor
MLTPAGFGGGPFLQNPYYFMFASLAKPDDDTELHWMKVCVLFAGSALITIAYLFWVFLPKDGKTRCTTGSVVSSLYHLKDSENDNRDAGFFVFPDLSVRQEGSYRLKLSLFEVVGCVSHIIYLSLHKRPPSHSVNNTRALVAVFHNCHKPLTRDSSFYSHFRSFQLLACFHSILPFRPHITMS